MALQPGEAVRALLPVRDLEEEDKYVFFATRKGTVKKTALKDFSNVMSRGIIAIGIDTDDELVSAQVTDGQQIILLATHEGMAVRFDEEDVRVDGTSRLWRARHEAGGQGLHRRHGGDSEAGLYGGAGGGAQAQEQRQVRGGAGGSEPDPDGFRKRLRQTHSGGRLPAHRTRRQRRDQREDHGAQRTRGGDSAGERESRRPC